MDRGRKPIIVGTIAVLVLACSVSERAPLRSNDFVDSGAEAGVGTNMQPLAELDAAGLVPMCPSNACIPPHADCNGDPKDGCEINLRSDIHDCGQCGNECQPDGSIPQFTTLACVDGKCVYLCTDDPLYGPMRNCAGKDPTIGDPINGCPNQLACDPNNCGACGVVAPPDSMGNQICAGGTPFTDCPAGTTNCEEGVCGVLCYDLNHDPNNCGACGHSCPLVSAAAAAKHLARACDGPNKDGGLPECTLMCDAFWADCNGDLKQTIADLENPAFDGCEVFVFNNMDDCGACGIKCNEICHTKKGSQKGEQICDCPAGNVWCPNPAPGECVDLNNDPHHCGSCDHGCPGPWDSNYQGGNGNPICVGGQCGYKCNAGWADCNQTLLDGCEVDVLDSPDNCGACGHACAKDQRCGNGECLVQPCGPTPAK